jgi:enoyl-CoA hydratase/carnithine racemase
MGVAKAMEVLLLEKRITASEALDYGLVNSVVPNDQMMNEAWILARKLAELPPLTVRFTKHCVQQGLNDSLESVRVSAGWAQMLTRLRTDEQKMAPTKK